MAVLSNPIKLVPVSYSGVGSWPLNGATVVPFANRVVGMTVKSLPVTASGGTTPPSYYWS